MAPRCWCFAGTADGGGAARWRRLSRSAARCVFGWFCVRLSGVYLAMLTLAFAQIAWSIAFQWDSVTGGSNGMIGVWPRGVARRARPPTTISRSRSAASASRSLWRVLDSPFGYSLRASRDSPLRADAIGIDVRRTQWIAFIVAGTFAGIAGALFAFSKGSISPETLSVQRSVDALVMVLLGGVQTLTGPLPGARRSSPGSRIRCRVNSRTGARPSAR